MDYRALILALISLPVLGQWGIQFYNPANNYMTLGGTTERIGVQYRMLEPFTIAKVGYRVNSVSSAGSVEISIQGNSASGEPDGNILASVTTTISSSGIFSLDLSNSVSVQANGIVWLVFRAVNPGSTNISFFSHNANAYMNARYASGLNHMFVIGATYSSGTWGSFSFNTKYNFTIYNSSGNPPADIHPSVISAATTASTSSNPNEGGIACTFDRPVVIIGIGRSRATGGTVNSEYRIYKAGTQIASLPVVQLPSGPSYRAFIQMFPQPILLVPGVQYIFSSKPLSTTSESVDIFQSMNSVMPDYLQSLWHWKGKCTNAARKDNGAWTFGGTAQFWDVRPFFAEAFGSW
jgi:hypothetical protein